MEAATRLRPATGEEQRRRLHAVGPSRPRVPDVDAVRVFDADPDLLRGLEPAAVDLLRRRVTVPKLWIEAGVWLPPGEEEARSWHGLLVLDGLMVRSLHLDGRACPELVGAGDLLRPWDDDGPSTVPLSVTWTALERTMVAVLDERYAAALCRWPAIAANVLARTVQRSRALAFHLAVAHVRHADTRLRMLLWHLADRWGRVTPAGIHLPLALTHETLAHLACMRRPTASSALQRLRAAGELERTLDGTWLLTGEPPVEAA